MRHLKSTTTSIAVLPESQAYPDEDEHNPDKPRGFGDVQAVLRQ